MKAKAKTMSEILGASVAVEVKDQAYYFNAPRLLSMILLTAKEGFG